MGLTYITFSDITVLWRFCHLQDLLAWKCSKEQTFHEQLKNVSMAASVKVHEKDVMLFFFFKLFINTVLFVTLSTKECSFIFMATVSKWNNNIAILLKF